MIIQKTITVLALTLLVAACGKSSDNGPSSAAPIPTTPPTIPVTQSGIDQRPANLACVAPLLPGSPIQDIALEEVFSGLPGFNQPLAMMQIPNDSSRWFVLQKTGQVKVFDNDSNISNFNTDYIDLDVSFNLNDGGEGGLLGMAFHPDYASNGEVFLSWTENSSPMVSVVARFTSSDGGITLDPGSRDDIISINQDFSNHNGGNIAFGSDGNLYIGMGDGGSGGDPNSRAQDTTNLLGAMLRVNIDGASPYAIPDSNPFEGNAVCSADHSSLQNCPEIFAWGLRNPWRWSFDSATGDLWAGDVGQGELEEIDIVNLNGNYGWDCREGDVSFSGGQANSCAAVSGLIDPVHVYPRSDGNSVTGGYVYRGSILPAYIGDYFFADYGSGRIWRLTGDGSGGWAEQELVDTSLSIASFAQGNDGELYVIDIARGGVHKIVAGSSSGSSAPPMANLLSATGCVVPQDPTQPSGGLIAYDIAADFWSDNADKERWFAIPDDSTIDILPDGDFTFPNGSVLMKHFRLNGALIETRLFMRHPGGTWAGYSYEWNDQETEATLVNGGKVEAIDGQSWIFPSSNDCLACHTAVAGFALGPEIAQINHDFTYTLSGRTANQIFTLNEINMFSTNPGDSAVLPMLVDPTDTSGSLDERARAYLHSNCAQCHRSGGPTPSSMDLHFATALNLTGSCDALPQSGNLGIGASARIIAPGDPDSSVLLSRMNTRNVNAMPPLGSAMVDTEGVLLIRNWISSLSTCQ